MQRPAVARRLEEHPTPFRRRSQYLLGLLVTAALVAGVARDATALDFYVDQAHGSDSNSPVQAQSPATPWATIGKALSVVGTGHTIRVEPGTYAQALQSHFAGRCDGERERSHGSSSRPSARHLDVAHGEREPP
jgi:hypothetical protein